MSHSSLNSLESFRLQYSSERRMLDDWDPAKVPHLPQEIWDCIIDFIEPHTPQSYTSLICKAWTPRSQRNLYRGVFIRSQKMFKHLIRTLATHPEYGTYIQKISFTSMQRDPFGYPSGDFDNPQLSSDAKVPMRWPYSVLDLLTPFLTNLVRMTVTGHSVSYGLHHPRTRVYLPLDSTRAPKRFWEAMAKHADTLQVLGLSIASFSTLTEFAKLVLSFRRLRKIDINHVRIANPDVGNAVSFARSLVTLPTLDEIVFIAVDAANGVAICDFLVMSGLYKNLSVLHLHTIDCSPSSQYAIAAGNLIRTCGPSLRSLYLGLQNVLKLSRTGYFSFSSNLSLLHLNINQHVTGPKDTKRTKRLHWLVSLLSTIPSDSKLQSLTLSLNMPFNPHKTHDASLIPNSKLGSDFAQLDKLFISEPFKNLESIKWNATIVDLIGSGDVVIQTKVFPLTTQRNILEFKASSISYQGYMWDFDDPEPDSEDDV